MSYGNELVALVKYDQDGMLQFFSSDFVYGQFGNMVRGSNDYTYMVGRRNYQGVDYDAIIDVYTADGSSAFRETYDYIGKDDGFNDVQVDEALNIYVCGYAENSQNEQEGICAKYMPDGTSVWIQNYDFPQYHVDLQFIDVGQSGNIYTTGLKHNPPPGSLEVISLTYNNDGVLLEEFIGSIDGYSAVFPTFALLDDDENLFIGGIADSVSNKVGFLMKVKNGVMIWSRVFPGSGNSCEFHAATLDLEGNIICVGDNIDNTLNAYIVKVSPSGGILNEALYNIEAGEDATFRNVTARDGYYYCCGYGETSANYNYTDVSVVKYDTDLNFEWDATYNSFDDGADLAYCITLDQEDNILTAGKTISTGLYKSLIIKYGSPLNINESEKDHASLPSLYPNPAHQELNISAEGHTIDGVNIYTLTGQQLLRKRPVNGTLDISALQPGMYIVEVSIENTRLRQKLLIE